MCNFFTCHSAVFLLDLEHTFHTLVISRRSGLSWLRVILYAQPSLTKALSPAWNCASVNSFHTTHFHRELWNPIGVFPRNISILMYARWSSLVMVPETQTATISTLCRFHMHTPPETKYTALASRSSPVQMLKWWDRWPHYLRSVANVCISFEITLVWQNLHMHMFTGWLIPYEQVLRDMKWNWDGIRKRHYMCLADNVQSLNATWIFIPFKLLCVNKDTWRSFWRDRDISKIKTIDPHVVVWYIIIYTLCIKNQGS